MEEIKEFLKISTGDGDGYGNGDGDGYGSGYGSGDGYGDGSGFGYGDGSGFGFGFGNGDGDGSGFGSGSGNGSGDGSGDGDGDGSGDVDGLGEFNHSKIFIIDSIETIITSIKHNIAKGFILNSDLTLTSCYVMKQDNMFAHGSTIKEAFKSLNEKLFNNYTIEERITKFKEEFKDFSLKYKARDLFDWHNKLTSSCKMGRESFAKDRDINLETDSFTIYEFIDITKDSYGGDIIKQLI